jgi:hypothetical protein
MVIRTRMREREYARAFSLPPKGNEQEAASLFSDSHIRSHIIGWGKKERLERMAWSADSMGEYVLRKEGKHEEGLYAYLCASQVVEQAGCF